MTAWSATLVAGDELFAPMLCQAASELVRYQIAAPVFDVELPTRDDRNCEGVVVPDPDLLTTNWVDTQWFNPWATATQCATTPPKRHTTGSVLVRDGIVYDNMKVMLVCCWLPARPVRIELGARLAFSGSS